VRLRGLRGLKPAVDACRACPLWARATQGVPGAGPARASIVFVGEQPGDAEDLAGAPFVGPAGRLLDRALVEAGLARDEVYVTNAVKHFKWIPRGKRRLHKTPTQAEAAACLDWLLEELRLVRPKLVVCLGATATRALLGPTARVLRDRGKLLPSPHADRVMVTVHPSSLLRTVDEDDRHRAYAAFVADLRTAKKLAR
jgi:DNA polymerase